MEKRSDYMELIENITDHVQLLILLVPIILFVIWLYAESKIRNDQRKIEKDPDLKVSLSERKQDNVRKKYENRFWVVYSFKNFFKGS